MTELQKKLFSMKEEELRQVYRTLFDSPEGRLVLEDLRNRCHYYTSTAIVKNEHVSHDVMNRNEGMRTVILTIDSMVKEFEPEPAQQEPTGPVDESELPSTGNID